MLTVKRKKQSARRGLSVSFRYHLEQKYNKNYMFHKLHNFPANLSPVFTHSQGCKTQGRLNALRRSAVGTVPKKDLAECQVQV